MRKFYCFGLLVLLSVFLGVMAQTVTVNNIVYPKSVIRKSFLSFSNDRH